MIETLTLPNEVGKKLYVGQSCGTLEYKIKDYKTRKINHSILNDENCIIVYRQRRYICDTCRKTFYEKNPFFQSSKSYSSYTRLRVLKELKTPETTFKKLLRIVI